MSFPLNKNYKQESFTFAKRAIKPKPVLRLKNKALIVKKKVLNLPLYPIVWILCSHNNTILTLTDFKGNTLSWSSAGVCGFKNSRKSTAYASEMAAINLSEKIYSLGFKTISVKIRGIGRGKKKALSALSRSGLFLKTIEEYSSIPFNGCRKKRKSY